MPELLLSLLPLALAALAAPGFPILILLMVQGEGGLGRGAALMAGCIVVRLAQGVLFGAIFRVAEADAGGNSYIAATLKLVLGLLLLYAAFAAWQKAPDPDAPPPAWMARLGGVAPLAAFGFGALLTGISVKQWVFTLTALDEIQAAPVTRSVAVTAYLLFVLATQAFMLVVVLYRVAAPVRSVSTLAALQAWFDRNFRTIKIVVSLAFGLWFGAQGLMGLLR